MQFKSPIHKSRQLWGEQVEKSPEPRKYHLYKKVQKSPISLFSFFRHQIQKRGFLDKVYLLQKEKKAEAQLILQQEERENVAETAAEAKRAGEDKILRGE